MPWSFCTLICFRISEKTPCRRFECSPLQGFEASRCIPHSLATQRVYQAEWRQSSKSANLETASEKARRAGDSSPQWGQRKEVMTMAKWLFAALLLLQVHFTASFLVPLDREAQQTFGGLLRWAWP